MGRRLFVLFGLLLAVMPSADSRAGGLTDSGLDNIVYQASGIGVNISRLIIPIRPNFDNYNYIIELRIFDVDKPDILGAVFPTMADGSVVLYRADEERVLYNQTYRIIIAKPWDAPKTDIYAEGEGAGVTVSGAMGGQYYDANMFADLSVDFAQIVGHNFTNPPLRASYKVQVFRVGRI